MFSDNNTRNRSAPPLPPPPLPPPAAPPPLVSHGLESLGLPTLLFGGDVGGSLLEASVKRAQDAAPNKEAESSAAAPLPIFVRWRCGPTPGLAGNGSELSDGAEQICVQLSWHRCLPSSLPNHPQEAICELQLLRDRGKEEGGPEFYEARLLPVHLRPPLDSWTPEKLTRLMAAMSRGQAPLMGSREDYVQLRRQVGRLTLDVIFSDGASEKVVDVLNAYPVASSNRFAATSLLQNVTRVLGEYQAKTSKTVDSLAALRSDLSALEQKWADARKKAKTRYQDNLAKFALLLQAKVDKEQALAGDLDEAKRAHIIRSNPPMPPPPVPPQLPTAPAQPQAQAPAGEMAPPRQQLGHSDDEDLPMLPGRGRGRGRGGRGRGAPKASGRGRGRGRSQQSEVDGGREGDGGEGGAEHTEQPGKRKAHGEGAGRGRGGRGGRGGRRGGRAAAAAAAALGAALGADEEEGGARGAAAAAAAAVAADIMAGVPPPGGEEVTPHSGRNWDFQGGGSSKKRRRLLDPERMERFDSSSLFDPASSSADESEGGKGKSEGKTRGEVEVDDNRGSRESCGNNASRRGAAAARRATSSSAKASSRAGAGVGAVPAIAGAASGTEILYQELEQQHHHWLQDEEAGNGGLATEAPASFPARDAAPAQAAPLTVTGKASDFGGLDRASGQPCKGAGQQLAIPSADAGASAGVATASAGGTAVATAAAASAPATMPASTAATGSAWNAKVGNAETFGQATTTRPAPPMLRTIAFSEALKQSLLDSDDE